MLKTYNIQSMCNTSHDIQVQNMETNKAIRELIKNSTMGHGKGDVRNNTEIQKDQPGLENKTRVKCIIQVVKQQEWRCAGHVARMNDSR